MLASRDGKIVFENSLDARLDVVFRKKLPEVVFSFTCNFVLYKAASPLLLQFVLFLCIILSHVHDVERSSVVAVSYLLIFNFLPPNNVKSTNNHINKHINKTLC